MVYSGNWLVLRLRSNWPCSSAGYVSSGPLLYVYVLKISLHRKSFVRWWGVCGLFFWRLVHRIGCLHGGVEVVTPRRACAKQGLCDWLCPFLPHAAHAQRGVKWSVVVSIYIYIYMTIKNFKICFFSSNTHFWSSTLIADDFFQNLILANGLNAAGDLRGLHKPR